MCGRISRRQANLNLFLRLGVEVLLQRDAELVAQGLELLEILVVLGLALDLGLDACVRGKEERVSGNLLVLFSWAAGFACCTLRTFKDADGSGKVVDSAGGLEGSGDDGGGGDEIVGEGVVQVALRRSWSAGWDEGFGCRGWVVMWVHTWSSKTSWTLSNSFSNL